MSDRFQAGERIDRALVASAEYPDCQALIRLFEDPQYRRAHRDRRAAVDAQRVAVANRLGAG